jgi:tetratricopeptide (TPR) repeat protein
MIWASALRAKGWYPEAEAIWRRTMNRGTTFLGASHPMTLEAVQGLANTIIGLGRWDEAEALHRIALQGWTETLESNSRRIRSSRNRLAEILIRQGRLDEAESYLSDVPSQRESFADRRAGTLGGLQRLAMLRLAQGRIDEAESLSRERLRLVRDLLGDDVRGRSPMMFEQARLDLAVVLSRQGLHVESERLILDSIGVLRKTLRESHPRLLTAKTQLAEVLQAAGRRAAAAELYREVLGHWLEAIDAQEPVVLRMRNRIGELCVAMKRYDEAESEFRIVLQVPGDASPDHAREHARARTRIAELSVLRENPPALAVVSQAPGTSEAQLREATRQNIGLSGYDQS